MRDYIDISVPSGSYRFNFHCYAFGICGFSYCPTNIIVEKKHSTYLRWQLRNGCARVKQSMLFDLFKALG